MEKGQFFFLIYKFDKHVAANMTQTQAPGYKIFFIESICVIRFCTDPPCMDFSFSMHVSYIHIGMRIKKPAVSYCFMDIAERLSYESRGS